MEEYYKDLERIFSKAAPVYDAKIKANFINRMIRRTELTTLLKSSEGLTAFLEIGSGTGEESKNLLQRAGSSVSLTAIDISPYMTAFSRQKIRECCPGARFDPVTMRASEIGDLKESFDVVYSFNGALNTEPDIDSFFKGLLNITKSGSIFIASLRNRVCLGETLIYGILRKPEKILGRRSPNPVSEVVGEKVTGTYYLPREFLRLVPSEFKLQKIFALGAIVPPYLAERFKNHLLQKVLMFFERAVYRAPVIRNMGDQTLYVFKRT